MELRRFRSLAHEHSGTSRGRAERFDHARYRTLRLCAGRRGRGADIHSIATSLPGDSRLSEKSAATRGNSSKAQRLSSREILIPRPGTCLWIRAVVAWTLQKSRRVRTKLRYLNQFARGSYRDGGSGTRYFCRAGDWYPRKAESWRAAGDFYPLTEPESDCELLTIWKKQCPMEPIISNFLDVSVAELKSR
jgi:hypothetical protein